MSTRYTAFPDYGANYGAGQEPQWSDPSWEYIDPVTGVVVGHPWIVSLFLDDGTYKASVFGENIYDNVLSVKTIYTPTEDPFEVDVSENDVVCLEYTFATATVDAAVDVVAVAGGLDFVDFKPTDADFTVNPPAAATVSYYPLAKIIDTGELDGDNNKILAAEQMARSHLAKTIICYNGNGIETFTPI